MKRPYDAVAIAIVSILYWMHGSLQTETENVVYKTIKQEILPFLSSVSVDSPKEQSAAVLISIFHIPLLSLLPRK